MKKNGFTLIEMLVVIAVFAVILSIVIANYPEMRRQLALSRATHQLMQDLRIAQEMGMSAFKADKYESCMVSPKTALKASIPHMEFSALPNPTAKGYGVYIDLKDKDTKKKYKVYADTLADDTPACLDPKDPCWGYYNLGDCVYRTVGIQEQGIIIKEIKNIEVGKTELSINFQPPNPDTLIQWLAEGQDHIEIVLAVENYPDKTKTISVNKSGLIEILH